MCVRDSELAPFLQVYAALTNKQELIFGNLAEREVCFHPNAVWCAHPIGVAPAMYAAGSRSPNPTRRLRQANPEKVAAGELATIVGVLEHKTAEGVRPRLPPWAVCHGATLTCCVDLGCAPAGGTRVH